MTSCASLRAIGMDVAIGFEHASTNMIAMRHTRRSQHTTRARSWTGLASRGRAVFDWRDAEYASECAIHVALVTEPRACRDRGEASCRGDEQLARVLDPHPPYLRSDGVADVCPEATR